MLQAAKHLSLKQDADHLEPCLLNTGLLFLLKKTDMLKHLLACIFIYTASLATAQNPVPNSSFENWANGKPVDWTYSNNVIQTSPGHSGQYAVKGYNFSALRCFDPWGSNNGFPVTQTYAYLNFYYQFHRIADEYLYVTSYTYDSIGTCYISQNILTGTDTFQPLSIPFVGYIPHVANDTVLIVFHLDVNVGSIPDSSYFVVDDVSLSNSSLTSISEANASDLQFTISPNPASSSINITTGELHNAEVTVYNMLGEALLKSKWNGTSRQLDISHFEQGFYIITVNQDGVFASRKFQKY